MTSNLGEYVTLNEAFRLTGLARETIRELLRSGDIVGERAGREWRIRLRDVRVSAARIGARPKCHSGRLATEHRFSCLECGELFRNPAAYRLHMRERHSGE